MPICFHSTPSISFFNHPGVSLLFPALVFELKPRLVAESRWIWRPRVFASLEVDRALRRKCSPLLDAELLSNANALASNEWRAVPDIWKSTAEKYGHQIALVDLYHDPPTELTYKQLKQDILDFSEGLRAVGLLPEEKIALFADNSCRWLVADQGTMATGAINVVRGTRSSNDELVKIYKHSDSIALVVDNPEFFNRLAESFIPRANIRFIVLLWGDKLFLNREYTKDIPLYDFNEIIELGHESRLSLFSSCKKGDFHAIETIEPDDIATLMYTSGTSGMPKGVMLSHRNLLHQVLGTVGHPLNFTEIMIVDLETGRPLPDGFEGIVKLRGPQIMNGYYKNASATGKAIDEDGWFNSGDIGWIVPRHSTGISRQCGGMLVFEGRAKDTIVLSTGENVEPSELEEAVMRSKLIQQIVVFGQDQRRLGALLVPNMDEVLAAAKNLLLVNDENPDLSKEKMLNLLHNEVRNWTKDCSFHIGPIMIVDEPFTIENGLLTPTMKVKRDKVIDLYSVEIANLYR